MKRIIIVLVTLFGLFNLTACSHLEGAGSNNSAVSDSNTIKDNSNTPSGQTITSAKCYKIDFQEVTEEQVAALFNAVPQKETNKYGTTHFSAGSEKASLIRSSGVGGRGTYYIVLYYTEQGDNYDAIAYKNYEKTDANKDWDFLSRTDAEQKISDILSVFMPTGTSVKAYAISKESYSRLAEEKSEEDKKWAEQAKGLTGAKYEEKDWGTAADYYYFTVEQTVDGIPIQSELIGNIDNGTQTWGSEASAVLSAEGLGFLRVFSPLKIIGEVETSEKFITFSEAEQMFKEKNDSFLTTEEITLEYSRLVYVVLRAEDNSLILTPAWEFKYNGEQFFRVNAYTGEEVVTV